MGLRTSRGAGVAPRVSGLPVWLSAGGNFRENHEEDQHCGGGVWEGPKFKFRCMFKVSVRK